MIKLFELDNSVVKPTVHCQMIPWLRVIMYKFPEQYLKIYAYIFYMACPSEENPYFNVNYDLREEVIISDLHINFSLEEDEIIKALEKVTKLYETPTVRAYKAMSIMLDNLSDYMTTTKITGGRDGNITALVQAAKNFDELRESFKGVAKDLAEEQERQVRGGQDLAYDQSV